LSVRRAARPRLTLAALASCGVLVSISQTIVVPLLPELPRITHSDPADVSWLLTVTLLAGAVFTPLLGRAGYFNLSAGASPTILDHQLQIMADRFTPVDKGLIPTGELRLVAGTPFDFTKGRKIGESIDLMKDEQIAFGGGYDHNFVLNGQTGTMRPAARVTEPTSGRVMEMSTDEPGVQFYTGNFLDGSITGRGGTKYVKRSGFCLETQHFPDSPNKPAFPSVVLRPGQTKRSAQTQCYYWKVCFCLFFYGDFRVKRPKREATAGSGGDQHHAVF
jgi:hypothetical protein